MSVHFFDENQRCNYQRHNEQAAELDAKVPSFANRSSGVFTGCAVTTGPGRSLNVAAGKVLVNRALKSVSAGALSANNNTFSFVYISGAGTLSQATMSQLPSTFAVLAVAQASGGSIRALRDLRVRVGEYVLLSPGGSTAWRLGVATDGALFTESL